ncbi:hypothetical protein [Teredinibacter franksiae]|uniref:hypothetical protein n=1 Tax=Teredinibacter franksiae TaxID=2761453 RepID=UPI001628F6C0|nr:hypothetical protein [Teredinibacter franksiae]
MKKTHIFEAIGIVVILLLTFLSIAVGNFFPIEFKAISDSDIAAIVASMFVISVFMERSIEAILVPVRAPDRQILKQEIARLQGLDSSSSNNSDIEALKEKENEFELYRLGTAKRAYWISFVFGLLISLVGVRVLSGFVDLDTADHLTQVQANLFTFIDVVLTGGVIAGGSAAIDKIGRKISGFYNLKSATNQG